jgi:hypothetical protein
MDRRSFIRRLASTAVLSSAAARAPVPGPAELKKEIEALESWVKSIRDRRR